MTHLALLLILGLGAPDFAVREWCQAGLSVYPEGAGPLLWRDTPDPEVNRRLRDVRAFYEPSWLAGEWKLAAAGETVYRVCLRPGGAGSYVCVCHGGPDYRYPFRWHYRPGLLTLVYPDGAVESYHLTPRDPPTSSPLSALAPHRWSRPGRAFRTRCHFYHPAAD